MTIRQKRIIVLCLFAVSLLFCVSIGQAQIIKQEIPDRLVVLTFDDAVSTRAEVVAPLLDKYNFGGTFFVCEFPPDFDDKEKYMTWEQIAILNEMGFEIGNHTTSHTHVDQMRESELVKELIYIEKKGAQMEIPKPTTFAYPAYATAPYALDVLEKKKYTFARVGGGRAYDPQKDHPYLIPSFSTTGTDTARVIDAFQQARDGKIVVMTIHGVPDYAHDWVTTPPGLFKYYLEYLDQHDYAVIALEDLAEYVNPKEARRLIKPNF
ncbi:polysaccharide deacetylase family protein [Aliifodinibius sp. S!AR15-10]|uniref:polysaccharide deacetylase family protein n=1 Tax=Aliifodinibius sp. S!AR15-10 TaxID=2950437 RepID=UPI0028558ABF|nr:polysaccharide deacetylase family protein [Aliifodinibius sp. S!AR15-10]MDR8394564.1 polysaccharide deacetylase family protein [Aliifodinibius sp. S!AR15-10]